MDAFLTEAYYKLIMEAFLTQAFGAGVNRSSHRGLQLVSNVSGMVAESSLAAFLGMSQSLSRDL